MSTTVGSNGTQRQTNKLCSGGCPIVALAIAIGACTPSFGAALSSQHHSPMVKVRPKAIGIPGDGINCDGVLPNSTSICHVTLSSVGTRKLLRWTTSSDVPAEFSPSRGYLRPGRQRRVIIKTKFCGGYTHFYFEGPNNVEMVTFQCG